MFWNQKAKDLVGTRSDFELSSSSGYGDGVGRTFSLSGDASRGSQELGAVTATKSIGGQMAEGVAEAGLQVIQSNQSSGGFVFGSPEPMIPKSRSDDNVSQRVASPGILEAVVPRISRPLDPRSKVAASGGFTQKTFGRDDIVGAGLNRLPTDSPDKLEFGGEYRLPSAYKNYRVVLPEGTRMEGDLSFTVPVRLEGEFKGQLVSSDIVVIGRNAMVKGSIKARVVLVQGMVQGPVVASHSVLLHEGSVMRGKLSAPKFVMEEGAEFNGTSEMSLRPRRASL